jgi:hypothetical protein
MKIIFWSAQNLGTEKQNNWISHCYRQNGIQQQDQRIFVPALEPGSFPVARGDTLQPTHALEALISASEFHACFDAPILYDREAVKRRTCSQSA